MRCGGDCNMLPVKYDMATNQIGCQLASSSSHVGRENRRSIKFVALSNSSSLRRLDSESDIDSECGLRSARQAPEVNNWFIVSIAFVGYIQFWARLRSGRLVGVVASPRPASTCVRLWGTGS